MVLYCEGPMFFRFKKSGERSYVQIVENKRIDGAVRQSVIANLGRDGELAASGALASLLASQAHRSGASHQCAGRRRRRGAVGLSKTHRRAIAVRQDMGTARRRRCSGRSVEGPVS